MKNALYSQIAKAVLLQMQACADGTETTTFDLMESLYGKADLHEDGYRFTSFQIDLLALIDLDNRIRLMARRRDIVLDDSATADAVVGYPFHCPYTIYHNQEAK